MKRPAPQRPCGTERLLEEQERRHRRAQTRGLQDFLLARAIQGMARESLDGPDREFLERTAVLAGVPGGFDRQRIFLPWALLRRDLTAASAAQAGFLVGTSNAAARDILRGWSVTMEAGIEFVGGVRDNLTIPVVTVAPTTHALPNGATSITESTPTLVQTALSPKNLGCFVDFSRQLLLQDNAESFVRMVMLGALGKFLDAQVLNGSGASGELLGLFGTAGLQTQSGTSLSHSGVTTMKKLSSEAGARDEDIAFVSTPAVRQVLETREKAAGNGGFVWQAGAVADRPAFASNDCPTASMVVGPWPQIALAQWGPPGITLEFNPYEQSKFKQGIIEARMVLSCDVGVIRPSAFVKSTSIT